MKILLSKPEDLDQLFQLYDAATAYQKEVGLKSWQGFDRSLVIQEIEAGRQYKIIVDNEIACVFLITDRDPLIWQEKDKDPSVYIHRIATHPKFRGKHFVKEIVKWVKQYALEHQKAFIRLDTGSGNERLNNYYRSCGFNYLGIVTLSDTGNLPAHYKDGSFSLFEMAV
jgi:ribosomal protein S18 acetylase RimI-like enzyme